MAHRPREGVPWVAVSETDGNAALEAFRPWWGRTTIRSTPSGLGYLIYPRYPQVDTCGYSSSAPAGLASLLPRIPAPRIIRVKRRRGGAGARLNQ